MNDLNLFRVVNLKYENRVENLNVESKGVVKSTKFFPTFNNENGEISIFKPLSKTKPFSTPLFACSEAFCSYLINKYIDNKAPRYQLAICEGITEDQPKYYERGTLVNSFLTSNQKYLNLLEYFQKNPDPKVKIDDYVNYCMYLYDYEPILNADIFVNNQLLAEQLAKQILISVFIRNQNFHYENLGFIIEDNNIVSLAPPIDHEFSTMFILADDYQRHTALMQKYDDWLINSNSIVNKNIALIAERYPAVAEEFINNLDYLITDLKQSVIAITDQSFIQPFSSDDWLIGYTYFKKNDKESAAKLEKTIEKKNINTTFFFNNLLNEFISSTEMLNNIINNHLKLNKAYIKKIN